MLICLFLPDFVVTLERSNPDVPTLVYDTSGKRHTVYALCDAARRLGITKGMAKGRVRALCSDTCESEAYPKRYNRLAHDRAMALLALTDRIELEVKDSLTIWLDVGKTSLAETKSMIEYLKAEIKEPFQGGIANGRNLARIAALTTPRNTIRAIAPGQEKPMLGPMRLEQFVTTKRFREECDQLGLSTLADLARLPYPAVRKRFGDSGAQLHRLYHGHDRLTLNPYAVPLREEIALAFDTPIDDLLIAERMLHRLTEHLAKRLLERGLACTEIMLTIRCENHTSLETSHTLREAIQSQKALTTELLRLLHQADLSTGIEGFQIVCDNLKPPAPQQLDFFGTLFGSPEPTIEQVAEQLAHRHPETPAYRMVVSQEHSYLPERNVILESVTAA